jgi:2-oxoisovalerate dehydrogenase E2 component (dihydrolipoyl transacylase)
MKTVAEFSIKYQQILDPRGDLVDALPAFATDSAELVRMYRMMTIARLMRSMVQAWRIEPALNAWYDPAGNSRILCKHMDLGVAVDTEGGLLVPVLRNIDGKSAQELRSALALQKPAAQERTIAAEDMQNPTSMLSNFGAVAGLWQRSSKTSKKRNKNLDLGS